MGCSLPSSITANENFNQAKKAAPQGRPLDHGVMVAVTAARTAG